MNVDLRQPDTDRLLRTESVAWGIGVKGKGTAQRRKRRPPLFSLNGDSMATNQVRKSYFQNFEKKASTSVKAICSARRA